MQQALLETTKHPPMLAQYLEYKGRHPDSLLLFQVGDFYEVFFEDAVTVARTLNLTLTSRDKNQPDPVPMCGVPIAVVDGYLDRLVDAGFSVAIVRQVGVPTGKGMVARQLERIVTPGVRLLAGAVSTTAEHIVASVIVDSPEQCSCACTNVQQGSISVLESVPFESVIEELSRRGATEVVTHAISEGKKIDFRTGWIRELTRIVPERACKFRVEPEASDQGRFQALNSVEGFGGLRTLGRRAVRLLVSYIDSTTVSSALRFHSIDTGIGGSLVMDAATLANLEITRNVHDGSQRGTLFEAVNRTLTPLGNRLLSRQLRAPLLEQSRIEERLSVVDLACRREKARVAFRDRLRVVPDLERIMARAELSAASPRELGALRDALQRLPELRELARELLSGDAQQDPLSAAMSAPNELVSMLSKALADSPPLSTADGGIFRDGYDEELDRLRTIQREGRGWLVELESRERAATGIPSLKVKYNGVLGFFIEVTKTHLSKIPEHYRRKQSMVGGERYTTEELSKLERDVLEAEGRLQERERKLFEELRSSVASHRVSIQPLIDTIAYLDMLLGFAELAVDERWVRPIVSDGTAFEVVAGKHPVLARTLGARYVPNDVRLDGTSCIILTGPNMGGKSTYLRQVALLTILAQVGCFVPAEAMRCGLVDRIFARIGASDNLHEGDSTFMVEMREASHILRRATARSLVLIDELGRGTATTDGMALAEAILEDLVRRIKARTLFATHFHELTRLEEKFSSVQNVSVGSEERGEDVHFTHAILPGPASRSYGIAVAKLAGLPSHVLYRAREILETILQRDPTAGTQLGLFQEQRGSTTCSPPERDPREEGALALIRSIDPDGITPREALQLLAEVRERLQS